MGQPRPCRAGLFDADGDGTPEPVFYNGYRAGEDIVGPSDPRDAGAVGEVSARSTSVARRLAIDNMAVNCMQGRGVMIDLDAHVGREQAFVGYDRLMRIMEADKVEVEAGRHGVLAHRLRRSDPGHESAAGRASAPILAPLDGRDERLLRWITDSGTVALISDNYAVEVEPARNVKGAHAALPLHEHCLFKLGASLGELWYLSPLADWLRAHARNRFLLTAPPLRLPGAVGSPATPVATV